MASAPIASATFLPREGAKSITTMYGSLNPRALAAARKVNLEPLVTDRLPFERYLDAYQLIEANRDRAMKVMITVEP